MIKHLATINFSRDDYNLELLLVGYTQQIILLDVEGNQELCVSSRVPELGEAESLLPICVNLSEYVERVSEYESPIIYKWKHETLETLTDGELNILEPLL